MGNLPPILLTLICLGGWTWGAVVTSGWLKRTFPDRPNESAGAEAARSAVAYAAVIVWPVTLLARAWMRWRHGNDGSA